MVKMPGGLTAPVGEMIYFAGEATDGDGSQGTVLGAVASGRKAAQQILENIEVSRRGTVMAKEKAGAK